MNPELHQIISTPPSLLRLFGSAVLSRKRVARRGQTLPRLRFTQRGLRIAADHAQAYAELCGFPRSPYVPATYPSVASLPLQLALLSNERLPISIVGIVHVANRIVQHRLIRVGEVLEFEYSIGETRTVDQGIEFDVLATARVADELVWESSAALLRRLPGSLQDASARKAHASPLDGVREAWIVGSDLGRRYARISGDYNPIHLSAATARALGFPRAIAHGMWTKARCIAALGLHEAEKVEVDVRFKQPLLLPGKAAFVVKEEPGLRRFEVQSAEGDKVHVSGTLRSKSARL
jgi:hypothetical protein